MGPALLFRVGGRKSTADGGNEAPVFTVVPGRPTSPFLKLVAWCVSPLPPLGEQSASR